MSYGDRLVGDVKTGKTIREAETNPPPSQPIATASDVKVEAGTRILAAFPDWKQRNMNMRATELQEIRIEGGTLSVDEQAEADALKAAAEWIKSVRAASDLIEADLGAMTVDEMKADLRWP